MGGAGWPGPCVAGLVRIWAVVCELCTLLASSELGCARRTRLQVGGAPASHAFITCKREVERCVPALQVCELCKSEIRNIPAPPPRPVEADMPALDEAYFNGGLSGGWGSAWVACSARASGLRLARNEPGQPAVLFCRQLAGLLVGLALASQRVPLASLSPLPARLPPFLMPSHRPTQPTLLRPRPADPNHIHDFMPSSQDLVFDCIRVCWVAMIVSILFFEMSLGAALWTGMLAGLAYSIMVRLMYRQHFYAMRRLAEQQAAARREQEAAAADGGAGEAPGAATAGAPPVVVAV